MSAECRISNWKWQIQEKGSPQVSWKCDSFPKMWPSFPKIWHSFIKMLPGLEGIRIRILLFIKPIINGNQVTYFEGRVTFSGDWLWPIFEFLVISVLKFHILTTWSVLTKSHRKRYSKKCNCPLKSFFWNTFLIMKYMLQNFRPNPWPISCHYICVESAVITYMTRSWKEYDAWKLDTLHAFNDPTSARLWRLW